MTTLPPFFYSVGKTFTINDLGTLGASAWVVGSDASSKTKLFATNLQNIGYPVWVCDGVADNVEIQAAIDALPAVGGKVKLTEGNFAISASVTLVDNIELCGMGWSTVCTWSGSSAVEGMFKHDVSGTSIVNVHIHDMYLDGNGDVNGVIWLCNVKGYEINGIFATNCLYTNGVIYTSGKNTTCPYPLQNGFVHHNIIWSDVAVDTSGNGQALYCTTWAKDIIFSNNIVVNPYELCIAIGSGSDTKKVENITVENNLFYKSAGIGVGVAIHGYAENINFNNNILYAGEGHGIYVYKDDGQTEAPYNVKINDNIIYHTDTSTTHAIFINTAKSTAGLVSIRGNDITMDGTNGGDGIDVTIAYRFDISHNSIQNPKTNGITFTASTVGSGIVAFNDITSPGGRGFKATGLVESLITGNMVKDSFSDGFQLVNCTKNTVTSNNIQDSGGWSITGGGTSDYNLVVSNTVQGGTSGEINTDLGANSIVRNNLGHVTENSGTSSIDSGTTTKAVAHGLSGTPTVISIAFREQGTNDFGRWWVDTIGATNFTLNVSADPGASNLDFAWEAKVK